MTKIFSVFFILWLGNCIHFAIDVVDEILILFENVFDIYGDIQGASNSFKIHAYEQGKKTLATRQTHFWMNHSCYYVAQNNLLTLFLLYSI